MYEGKLTLRVGNESVEFIMSKLMKYPLDDEACIKIVLLDDCVVHETFSLYSGILLTLRMRMR